MPERKSVFYDQLEVRSTADRDRSLLTALPGFLQQSIENSAAAAAQLDGIDPKTIDSFERLADVPLRRKSELIDQQRDCAPFGNLNGTPLERLAKVFVSPGPIFEPEGVRSDYWRFARALFAAGFRPGDLVHNTFAYHLTPAGSMAESGARALGCPVIPAGTGQTERQLEVIRHLRPNAYVGTPSFLKILMERATDEGMAITSFQKALVSGEAFPPALAAELEQTFGISAYQCYATADAGLIAYESKARDGLVIDEDVIVEIVRPGTGDPVAEGDVGEVVVTVFNPDYPLIRFATGDLSVIMPGPCPCGRTNRRLKGWMGRADQTTKVKGMFVHPGQIAKVAAQHDGIGRARLVVTRDDNLDVMTLECEAADHGDHTLDAIRASLKTVTGLNGQVRFVPPGTLPNDGKVIDDQRPRG
ncbi:MAG: phenylacetate--CoA ligase [Rhizobiales bacterium]|nr:phenylacetate--CoA ligase [Hyphomicrobiales bacterium]